jgi:uncharacterized repeat protein (TIGR03803 family)
MKKYCFLIFTWLCLGIGEGKAQYWVLHNFEFTYGCAPAGTLTLFGKELYGMTEDGGAGAGIIFSIDTNGNNFNDMLNFNGVDGDGGSDFMLIGNKLYGTSGGGAYGRGCIIHLDTNSNGDKDVFDFSNNIGAGPSGKLALSGKVFYGTTFTAFPPHQFGSIFSVDTDGSNYSIIHYFTDSSGGGGSDLTLSGNKLYGMTIAEYFGIGCVFSINTDGSNYKVLLNFNDTNGYGSGGSLILSGNKLYGMTGEGGANGDGVIFSIDTNGNGYKDMFDFNHSSGYLPEGSLILSGGLLYGTTYWGGPWYGGSHGNGFGCVFSIDTNGQKFKNLVYFDSIYGEEPQGGLTLSRGSLYGMTSRGGSNGVGVIFKLDTSSVASINNLPASKGSINLYPNPNNGIFTIALVGAQNFVPTLEIYNVLGERVYSQLKMDNEQLTINISSQPSGVYFYRVLKEDGSIVGSGKVIIQ